MHVSLYALLLALPISGWLAASDEGASVNLFWVASLPRWEFRTPPPVATPPIATAIEDEEDVARRPAEGKKEKNEVFEEAHEILGNVLLILASLHTLAALKHQFIDRDELLRRMLPRRARPVAPQSSAGS
jgi:cytochrome b561